jgi:hypothetical protein
LLEKVRWPSVSGLLNGAYLPTAGLKRDWVLGASARKVWAEIWPDIRPRAESVVQTGDAAWDEALLIFLERSGSNLLGNGVKFVNPGARPQTRVRAERVDRRSVGPDTPSITRIWVELPVMGGRAEAHQESLQNGVCNHGTLGIHGMKNRGRSLKTTGKSGYSWLPSLASVQNFSRVDFLSVLSGVPFLQHSFFHVEPRLFIWLGGELRRDSRPRLHRK